MIFAKSSAHDGIITRSIVLGCLAMIILMDTTLQADEIVCVGRWQPQDFAFTSNTESTNPFQTLMTAVGMSFVRSTNRKATPT